jgi:plastocyanin
VSSPFCRFVALLALSLCAFGARASSVTVEVTDPRGRPLADAVVSLAPLSKHLPVRPMSGVEIAQTHRQFAPQVTVVTVGTSIAFPNHDTVRHHVYSFSPVKTFELKLYSGVPASPVLFDKPGIAVLGCNIHDDMVAWVVVVDTPLFARSGPNGQAEIADVPPGNYELRVWHSELAAAAAPLTSPLVMGDADLHVRSSLATNGPRK